MADISHAEETVWSGKCSHWHYLGKWVLGIVTAPLLVGLGIIAWIFLDRAKRAYTVTPTRVIVESGIFARSSNEVRVQDIRSINVSKSGISGLMGIGNVEFSSAATDDADVIFFHIAEADKVRNLVRKLQS